MMDTNLITFVWNTIASGVLGNAAYDGIKSILGKGFDRLASFAKEKKKYEFEIALRSIIETNEKIAKELSQLREDKTNDQQTGIANNRIIQSASGNGIAQAAGSHTTANVNMESARGKKKKKGK